MEKLNFLAYNFRFKNRNDKLTIFDEIRKKYVIITSEEWVRQHVVQFLIHEKKYPKSLINVEKIVKVNDLQKRYDIVVFNSNGSIHILIECKAPTVEISQATFDQIARYNLSLNANFLMITNGLKHYFCKMDFENEKYLFLEELPSYKNPLNSY